MPKRERVCVVARDPEREAHALALRAIFEPYELTESGTLDYSKLDATSALHYIVTAARSLFWALDINDRAQIARRVGHMIEAAQDMERAGCIRRRQGLADLTTAEVDASATVSNIRAWAQSYLVRDLETMVKPAYKGRL